MYTADSYKKPFWAENSGFMTGRDPLGIQNSSVATYGRLLPGMTNLTLRLRYYGFYMWILMEYDKLNKSENEQTLNYQYNFVRRAELAIAYLMVNKYPKEMSIVGSEYANNHILQIKNLGYYDLASGADKDQNTEKGSVYWDYRSGALGQYYAGSLINLKLIEMSNRFFIILKKGKKLAQVFEKGLSDKSQRTMREVIHTGKLTFAQIENLDDFSINHIAVDSSEWSFYKDIIISDDGMTNSFGNTQSQRRETIKHYLEYTETINKTGEKLTFDQIQYLLNTKKTTHDASFGWYYYRINELFHYALETIFWGLLVELDGRIIDTKQFLETISQDIDLLSNFNFLPDHDMTVSEVLDSGFQDNLSEEQSKLELLVNEGMLNIEAMTLAFKMILEIYLENRLNMDLLYEYEKVNFLTDKKGRISDIVDFYIIANLNLPYRKFIYSSIKNLINDHISTAYRKMGNGESNLLKIVIEDNFITHVQTMKPKFTSPRLRTLDNFLKDMRFIEGEKLSSYGEELLIEISEKDDRKKTLQ